MGTALALLRTALIVLLLLAAGGGFISGCSWLAGYTAGRALGAS